VYNSTHSFFRNGDSIYISNKNGDDNVSLGTELVTRKPFEDHQITSSLIKHLLFRTCKDRFQNFIPVDFYPFRFFSRQEKDNLIGNSLPDDLKEKIAYKKLIEVQLRLATIGGKQQFGFLINIRRNWLFDLNCQELNSEGFSLIGLEVLHSEMLPGLTNVLAPNEEFIGVVNAIEGSVAKVTTNYGLRDFSLNELTLKKTSRNIRQYLSFRISPQKSDEIISVIESKRQEIYDPKRLYSEISIIAKHLFTDKGEPVLFQNKDGFCFTVDPNPLAVSNSMDLKTPTFIFDHAATKTTTTYPDNGLSRFGPYDSITFDIKAPKVLCVCNRKNRGVFTNFLHELKVGLPQSKYFQKGLQKKYDLQDITFDIREISSYELDEYINAIRSSDDGRPNLAIIEIPFEFRKYDDARNPYYRIKAKLLSLEIPVQFVTSEIIKRHNEYILNSMALQIYAKLGGTPWVLPSQRSVDKEIIIGIGHSWMRSNQFSGSDQERVVGITTFLSSDGQYLLGDKVKDVPFEGYFDELLASLKQSIDRLSSEQGWAEGDTVRLIFHIFKPIKNTEFEVVGQLVKDISKFKIKFAFVTISKFHPIMLFDPAQPGVQSYLSNSLKGEYVPIRGTNIFLDAETCVVQMLGANELKTSKQGMSSPIQIKIRTPQGNFDRTDLNDLLFYDLAYITQQIFSFTYLSWRSFLPGEEPATMQYSNLFSKLLGKMRNLPGWDSDNLNYGLKRKKWFL
jgi:hypothetical protein